jgi:DNA repair protein RadC
LYYFSYHFIEMEEEVLHLSIKQWAEDDRPREKMLLKGKTTLSDAELIAILLGSGSRNETAVQLAQRILKEYGNNLNELAKLSVADLQKFKGIGEAKAISIVAALELGRRRKDTDTPQQTVIRTSADAYTHIAGKLSDLPHEEFWILVLNRAHRVIKSELISKGGVSGTVADVRMMIKTAVENLASAIVLAHNHPSGNTRPSDADIQLTRKVRQAADLFDIQLLDHIIVGEGTYYSFADNGQV